MNKNLELANLIFPHINRTIDDLEKLYPPRDLKEGAKVTRFAPSPTGFLHTGSLFTSLVASKIARDSGGVFYIRLEDTDTKREIEGSATKLLVQLHQFGITPDEGNIVISAKMIAREEDKITDPQEHIKKVTEQIKRNGQEADTANLFNAARVLADENNRKDER